MIFDKIQCPHCNYDGGDLMIGMRMPNLEIGYSKINCSACKKDFRIIIKYECY